MSKSIKTNKLVNIKLGLNPFDAKIEIEGGHSLGWVQSINIEATPDSSPHVLIGTFCSNIELETLQKNTELQVTLWDDYKKKDLIKKWRELAAEKILEYEESMDANMVVSANVSYAESKMLEECANQLEELLIQEPSK